MQRFIALLAVLAIVGCTSLREIHWPEDRSTLTGTEFYRKAAGMGWRQRDSFAVKEILAGNVPGFLKKFVPVSVSAFDSISGRRIEAVIFVSPDYLSIGSDDDWARIPLTPMAAQVIADSLQCFLPTRKIVDDIYAAARVKLEPVPLYAFRDSTPTMWHHHLIIEGQRKGRRGLIAGIKKDVVISARLKSDPRTDRVAIYGWHLPGGKPIQPVYTGHVNWYVDYSHGIRLVLRKVKVDGRWMDYRDILSDPLLRRLLCDEEDCGVWRYQLTS